LTHELVVEVAAVPGIGDHAAKRDFMGKGRLEAFSDGVLAIIITIMVLELRVPHGHDLASLKPLWPHLIGYLLSFIYVGIYWSNHHHLMHAARSVSGGVLWANLHLLFWLSLIPAATAWMGETHFAPVPTALYGIPLLMAALAWLVLQAAIIAVDGRSSLLAEALGKDRKGKVSFVLYVGAIGLAAVLPWISWTIYAAVALIWLIPDRRIERALRDRADTHGSGG
jgi:uncharacterized membrane protein